MTSSEKAARDKLQKELDASVKKCKRLQKEKRTLETHANDDAECKRAHIEAGHEFDPGKRVYGTRDVIEALVERLKPSSERGADGT